jgi:septin 7
MIPTAVKNLGTISTDTSVGFSFVPDQIRERSIMLGFEINLLVVGRRGSGSSTLVNSIFAAPLVEKERPDSLTVTKNEIVENDICLEASVVTYHDADIGPLLEYIESVNREYFENEQSLYKSFRDNRIHVCLYILPSDTITSVEIRNMRELSLKCNLVPVISKADMYIPEELAGRKKEISGLLRDNGIGCFVPHLSENDRDLNSEITDIIDSMPFSVIASENLYEHEGEIMRGRKYPWGFINIDIEDGNDFRRLQRLLIYTNLDELIIKTNQVFYNEYRRRVFELESGCDVTKKARYTKLRAEMLKILGEKHASKVEDLRREEAELDRFYGERLHSTADVEPEMKALSMK